MPAAPPALPRRMARSALNRGRALLRRARHAGVGRDCPVCGGTFRAFMPYHAPGAPRRSEAQCPRCLSMERHRLTLLFLRERTDLFDGNRPKRLLHVAPEPCLTALFAEAAGDGYLTADLMDPAVMEAMDICEIPRPDGAFDVVHCSHVLEHVPDDRKAIAEFFRTLRPGGWAILNVPVLVPETDEDPTVTDPAERLRRFGQEDHVRVYGPDYRDRLAGAGFRVEAVAPADLLPAEADRVRYGVNGPGAGGVYYCVKD